VRLDGSANGQQNGQGGIVSRVVRLLKFVPTLLLVCASITTLHAGLREAPHRPCVRDVQAQAGPRRSPRLFKVRRHTCGVEARQAGPDSERAFSFAASPTASTPPDVARARQPLTFPLALENQPDRPAALTRSGSVNSCIRPTGIWTLRRLPY
jgi:hypothetical protein